MLSTVKGTMAGSCRLNLPKILGGALYSVKGEIQVSEVEKIVTFRKGKGTDNNNKQFCILIPGRSKILLFSKIFIPVLRPTQPLIQ
jgi:hypothetical protein